MAEDYTVAAGDCISSIAYTHGFFWQTLWNNGANSQLKDKRKDPNILLAGDVVHIPDLQVKHEAKGDGARYQFKLKGVPAKLRIRLMKEAQDDQPPPPVKADGNEAHYVDPDYSSQTKKMEPRADVPYQLSVDGKITTGTTDKDGRIELSIFPNAAKATILLNPGTPQEETIPLTLGGLDPLDSIVGLRERLCNLGFVCALGAEEMTPDLESALRSFQETNGLSVSGKADDATRDKLKTLHGS